jgi:HD-GYP domain-containing protein (c-di-GMP phosphodiesterase class II)
MLNQETGPDSPERSPESEVEQIFTDLDINFKDQHPALFERLVEMHAEEESHFYDAIEMAKMIDKNWDRLGLEDLDKQKMILCALLHDIGKSGPAEASVEARTACRWLFHKSYAIKHLPEDADVRQLSMREFIDNSEQPDKDKVQELLTKELKIDIDQTNMIEFWRGHVDWTYDILSNHMKGDVDQAVVLITASHHILDGKNPANLKEEEVPESAQWIGVIEEYQILTLVDKYQAFRERSHLSHPQAIIALRATVEGSSLSAEMQANYLRIIDKFSDAEFAANLEAARQEAQANYHY